MTSTAAPHHVTQAIHPRDFHSVLVAVGAGTALFVALSLAEYSGLHWMMAIALCVPIVGGVLLMVPHVRRDLRYLAA